MEFSPAELAARLLSEGEAVQAFFSELRAEHWDLEVYADSISADGANADGARWRARDLLAHFIAAEQGFQKLIQSVAGGGPSTPPDFDINDYNARTVSELRPLENQVLLGQFAMVRERSVALVRAMTPDQLEKQGRHPALGMSTVSEMVRLIYNHNRLHLRDLRLAQRAGGSLNRPAEGGAAG